MVAKSFAAQPSVLLAQQSVLLSQRFCLDGPKLPSSRHAGRRIV